MIPAVQPHGMASSKPRASAWAGALLHALAAMAWLSYSSWQCSDLKQAVHTGAVLVSFAYFESTAAQVSRVRAHSRFCFSKSFSKRWPPSRAHGLQHACPGAVQIASLEHFLALGMNPPADNVQDMHFVVVVPGISPLACHSMAAAMTKQPCTPCGTGCTPLALGRQLAPAAQLQQQQQ